MNDPVMLLRPTIHVRARSYPVLSRAKIAGLAVISLVLHVVLTVLLLVWGPLQLMLFRRFIRQYGLVLLVSACTVPVALSLVVAPLFLPTAVVSVVLDYHIGQFRYIGDSLRSVVYG